MGYKTKYLAFLISALLYTFIHAQDSNNSNITKKDIQNLYDKAISISNSDPELSIQILKQCKLTYQQNKDTSKIIECLFLISEINKQSLNFSLAYDIAWEALILAENYGDLSLLQQVYQLLGGLYSMFGQEKESRNHFDESLNLSKQLFNGDKATGQKLISSYFNLVMLNSQFGKNSVGRKYLDSCFIISDKIGQDEIKRGYLFAESGILYAKEGNYDEAEKILLDVKTIFENIDTDKLIYENDKGYLVIIYSFIGDIYMWQGNFNSARIYWEKGLEAIDLYNSHKGLKADFLFKLSDIYYRTNEFKKAYHSIRNSKIINDSIFGSKSIKNSDLLEVKNKYREEIERKNREIAYKNELLLKKEKGLLKVKVFTFAFIALLIILILVLQNRGQRRKHKIKQENDKQLLRIKNKELTSFTLQFIEKDKIITELSDYIKEMIPNRKDNVQILNNAIKSRNDYWEEFNKRFVSVNQNFYENLSKRFPSLTSYDLKHCALIKLNFNAKEMSQLLGISNTSVHMAHHRLRKKMNLNRDVNLSNFISSI